MKYYDIVAIPTYITLASMTIILFYLLSKNRSLRLFAALGTCLTACFIMFCYTGSELHLYRLSTGFLSLILGLAIMIRIYDLPIGAILTFPIPIYLITSLNEMKSWHYILLGFILLIAGILFSIYKDNFGSVFSRFYERYTTLFLEKEKDG